MAARKKTPKSPCVRSVIEDLDRDGWHNLCSFRIQAIIVAGVIIRDNVTRSSPKDSWEVCPVSFHSMTTAGWPTLVILACVLVGSLGAQAGTANPPAASWTLSADEGDALSDTSSVLARANQTPFDYTPPAAVRDLGYASTGARGYPKGFFIPAYFPLDQTATQILNERFHLTIVGRDSDHSGLDPDIITLVTGPAIVYSNSMSRVDEWNTIDANEDWFLHSSSETSPATRISLSGYSHLFYMNIGSQGWRDFVTSKYNDVTSDNPAIAGVFVDGVPTPAEYESQLGTTFPDYDASTYQVKILELITEIRNAVSGKLVILNSELFKPFTLAADGGMAEGFVHFGGHRNDAHINQARWLQNIETIADKEFDNKYLLIGSGSLEATLPSLVEYCYASFLLGYNQAAHCYFYWHSNAEGGYSAINWFALWELDIGEPEGRYVESNGVYERSFSEGIVLVNPNDEGGAITVDLGDVYVDSAGNIVTSVILHEKSAVVLKRAPWSS
jgi:hypothetical protein